MRIHAGTHVRHEKHEGFQQAEIFGTVGAVSHNALALFVDTLLSRIATPHKLLCRTDKSRRTVRKPNGVSKIMKSPRESALLR